MPLLLYSDINNCSSFFVILSLRLLEDMHGSGTSIICFVAHMSSMSEFIIRHDRTTSSGTATVDDDNNRRLSAVIVRHTESTADGESLSSSFPLSAASLNSSPGMAIADKCVRRTAVFLRQRDPPLLMVRVAHVQTVDLSLSVSR